MAAKKRSMTSGRFRILTPVEQPSVAGLHTSTSAAQLVAERPVPGGGGARPVHLLEPLPQFEHVDRALGRRRSTPGSARSRTRAAVAALSPATSAARGPEPL